MNKEGQPAERKFTRRQFLRRAAILAAGLAVSVPILEACGPTPEKPGAKPTNPPGLTEIPKKEAQPSPVVEVEKVTPQATATSVATEAPKSIEPTKASSPTPEVVKRTLRIKIIGELLTRGLTGIGERGKTILPTPTPGKGEKGTEISNNDLLSYASNNWQEKIEASDLTKNRVSALKFLLSVSQQVGFENTTFDVEGTFPEIKGLSLLRVTINNLPSGEKSEVISGASPSGLEIREGTHMTIIGTVGEGKVLVTFDWWNGEVPRQHWAVVSQDYLGSLLAKNNFSFKDGEISFKDEKGTKCIYELNTIEEKFAKDLVIDTGVLYLREYENPFVPFPPEGTAERTGDGRAVAKDPSGKEIYEAKYNEKTKEWEWEKIVEVAKEEIEGLKAIWNGKEKRWEYVDPEDGYVAGFWNEKEKRFEIKTYEYKDQWGSRREVAELRRKWRGLFLKKTMKEIKLFPEYPQKHPISVDLSPRGLMLNVGLPTVKVDKSGRATPTGELFKSFRFYNLSSGSQLRAPFSGKVERYGWGSAFDPNIKGISLYLMGENNYLNFSAVDWKKCLPPEVVNAGETICEIESKSIPAEQISLSRIPEKYWEGVQLTMTFADPDSKFSRSLTFDDILTDRQGRFIYISP